MHRTPIHGTLLRALLVGAVLLSACRQGPERRQVVVYTSVDQIYAEPILQAFEEQTGIQVLPVFDVEAVKTTGLVNRLLAEKSRPQADVFWNGEFAQTLLLQEEGVLAPYHAANARDIPAWARDRDGYWTGFAGRARVLIVNTERVPAGAFPTSLYDLLDPARPAGEIGLAYPMFGTTATHAAALYALWGAEQGRAFFEGLKRRGVRVVDGNAVVRDLVAAGHLQFGLTDTDDACGALARGAPVAIVFPDQEGQGTLVMPNTVALIAGAPHPEEGKTLIDSLLSRSVAEHLVRIGWSHIPLRPLDVPVPCFGDIEITKMEIGLKALYQGLQQTRYELGAVFIR